MKSICIVIGTRPEAIKLAPVIAAIRESEVIECQVCITRQHTDLLDPLLARLDIPVDYQFAPNPGSSSLHENAGHLLREAGQLFASFQPDLVMVQGDTTTAFAVALGAFYAHIPVAHLESGLRTGELLTPWPEEAHRQLISRLTTYSFAPTWRAREKLIDEGVPLDKVWVVGNTSIDALRLVRQPIDQAENPTLVVTVHRRENHGERLLDIAKALRTLAHAYPHLTIQFFLHPNPAVCTPIRQLLVGFENVHLIPPTDHVTFIQFLDRSLFILTDSGGIQEEAPFIGKPVLILRDSTERPEGVEAGTARLVGTQASNIVTACKDLIENPEILAAMSRVHFPYGDGYAAQRVTQILESQLAETTLCVYSPF